jgi:transposase InsO family protein
MRAVRDAALGKQIQRVHKAPGPCDNALAETTIGLYKTECIRAGLVKFNRPSGPTPRSAPGRCAPSPDVENITSAWVHWYNTSRLMHRLGRRPPAEAEAAYHQHAAARPGRLEGAGSGR